MDIITGGTMEKIISKKQIMTIPNLLSFLRLVMVPFIVWLYGKDNYYGAAAVVVLSGITDIFDGLIARKFNMISDFGKILDPIADKITQCALIVSLSLKYPEITALIVLFVIKECIMGLLGYITIKSKESVNSAKWYGKLSTFVLYASMFTLIVLPEISIVFVRGFIILCGLVLLLSLVMYTRFYVKILSEK
jgi:cardiolipin synthase